MLVIFLFVFVFVLEGGGGGGGVTIWGKIFPGFSFSDQTLHHIILSFTYMLVPCLYLLPSVVVTNLEAHLLYKSLLFLMPWQYKQYTICNTIFILMSSINVNYLFFN